jgi:hypothetical protein
VTESSNEPRFRAGRPTQRDISRFIHFPRHVSEPFRRALIGEYPNLECHRRAAGYRRIAEYLIFSPWTDSDDPDLLPLPHEHVKLLVGACKTSKAFSALDWLEAFSRDVWPLSILPYDKDKGKARMVRRDLPPFVKRLIAIEPILRDKGSVWFFDGSAVSEGKLYGEVRRYMKQVRLLADGVDADHPAYDLLTLLNQTPPHKLGQLLRANQAATIAEFDAMPEDTPHERRRKQSAKFSLQAVWDMAGKMAYQAVANSPRLYTIGVSIHGLPRRLRKIILAGCVSLDGRACQLAIVAALWGVPELSKFLKGGRSIWKELIHHLGTNEDAKPTLKTAIYAIIFGMRMKKLRELLVGGDDEVTGLPKPQMADLFLAHPIIKELLKARRARLRALRHDKFVVDAFGRRLEYDRHRTRLRSLLAQEVQSYEVALMLSLLPVLRAERDLTVVSFLHDGLTVWVPQAKRKRVVARLQHEFDKRAEELGFSTALEESDG